MLPKQYPKHQTIYSFYRRATQAGQWEEMTDLIVQKTRQKTNRKPTPSYSLIDSQSTKTTSASDQRGFDGGKKSKA